MSMGQIPKRLPQTLNPKPFPIVSAVEISMVHNGGGVIFLSVRRDVCVDGTKSETSTADPKP